MPINHKKTPRYTVEQKREMYEMYLKFGFTNVIETFHISKSTLSGILKENKIPVQQAQKYEPESEDLETRIESLKFISRAIKNRLKRELVR